MTTVRCIVSSSPAGLLDRVLDEVTAGSDGASGDQATERAIVVRQGTVRDDLLRRAHERGLPCARNQVSIFSEIAAAWTTLPAPLTRAERWVVLARIAGEVAPSWWAQFDALIGELLTEGVSPDALRTAMRSGRVQRDVVGGDAFAHQLDDTILTVYGDYVAALDRHRRIDGRDAIARLARAIASGTHTVPEHVHIAGVTDIRGGWGALVVALAQSAVVSLTLYLPHPLPELDAMLQPLVDGGEIVIERVNADAHPKVALTTLQAPDAERELEHVALRIRALIDQGTPARSIAVIARESRPLVDDATHALELAGVRVSARRRISLAETAPARALVALLRLSASGFAPAAIDAAQHHPLLDLPRPAAPAPIDARSRSRSERAEYEDRMRTTLLADGRIADLSASRTPSAWYAWIADVIADDRFGIASRIDAAPAGAAVALAERHALDRIVSLAREYADAEMGSPDGALHSCARFLPAFLQSLDEEILLPSIDDGVVVCEAPAAILRPFIHTFVVGLTSAAYPLPLARSSVLDSRRRFALRAEGLPIDTADSWRAREHALFHDVIALASESVTLSWPAADASGDETLRSMFVDELVGAAARSDSGPSDTSDAADTSDAFAARHGVAIADTVVVPASVARTPGYPLLTAEPRERDAIRRAARRAAITEGARTRDLSVYNGHIADPELQRDLATRFGDAHLWSPTSIEELAKCGWSWMARRLLALEEREIEGDDIEPAITGRILHAALDHFFEAARTHRHGDTFLRETDRAWLAEGIDAALDFAWHAESQVSWLGAPQLRALVRAELRETLTGFLSFEIAFNERSFNNRSPVSRNVRTAPLLGEHQFTAVPIETRHGTFLLHGIIDRVDRGIDDRVDGAEQYLAAIDYKSSKGATPAGGQAAGWDDGVVVQLPLYAYVLRRLFPDATLTRLEYRTLRSPASVHTLNLTKLDKADKLGRRAVLHDDAAAAKLDAAIDAAGARVAAVRRGEFATSPVASCGCSPYCTARDICRIPGGPVRGGSSR